MPTVASGYRTATPTGIAAERLVIEMQDQIYQYDPNKTPFLTVLSETGGNKASAAVYNHLEDEPLPSWDTLAEAMTTTETDMDVTTPGLFRVGDLVLIPTSTIDGHAEVVLITSLGTSPTMNVTRNWAATTTAVGTGGTAASGANILIIGNANAEGTGTRESLTTTEAAVQNYCQIIKTPYGTSGTLDATATYGPPDYLHQSRKAAMQHALEQERTFLFGVKRSTTLNSIAIRATGGIVYWLSTNTVNAGGTLTHSTMETLCQKVFRYGSGTKLFLCSRTVMSQLDNIAEARIQTVPEADTYGVKMRRYVSGHGDLMIKVHDLLINDYSGYGIVIDMNEVQKRFTVNREGKRDAMLRTNIQAPDLDAQKDEYLSEVGLHVHLEKAHGLLTGVA